MLPGVFYISVHIHFTQLCQCALRGHIYIMNAAGAKPLLSASEVTASLQPISCFTAKSGLLNKGLKLKTARVNTGTFFKREIIITIIKGITVCVA